MQVTITAVDRADPVGARLRRQGLAERGAERGAEQGAEDPGDAPADRDELFLIARDRATGTPVACGALRPVDPATAPHGDREAHRARPHPAVAVISFLFVVPEFRGHGLARLVLAELELQAAALGWFTLRLEAAADRPVALALCAAAGYAPTAAPANGVVVFEKRLPAAEVEHRA